MIEESITHRAAAAAAPLWMSKLASTLLLLLMQQQDLLDHDDNDHLLAADNHRLLQQSSSSSSAAAQDHRGQAVLMILYLCVLGVCFLTPFLYYLRLQCEERTSQRLYQQEVEAYHAALQQSTTMTMMLQQNNDHHHHHQEHLVAWRKYMEERRARLLQLFAPVRMNLKEEHFLRPGETERTESVAVDKVHNQGGGGEEEDETERLSDDYDDDEEEIAELHSSNDPQLGRIADEKHQHDDYLHHHQNKEQEEDDNENPYGEETSVMIRIPTPGLHNLTDATDQVDDNDDDDSNDNDNAVVAATTTRSSTTCSRQPTRLVSGMCTICLCNYQVGSDIVWSSNSACEHCFHENCIEQWLIKQKDGPLCPCCRRDFVVDPYDLEEDEEGNNHPKNNNNNRRHHHGRRPRQQVSTRRLWLNWTGSLDETVAMDQGDLNV